MPSFQTGSYPFLHLLPARKMGCRLVDSGKEISVNKGVSLKGSSAQTVVGASGSGGAGGAGGARPPGPCVMAAAAGPSPTGRCAWCGGGPPAPARSLPAPGPVMSSVRPSAQPRGAAPLGPPALGAPVPGGETRN